jgi:dephospho-CoA kinase
VKRVLITGLSGTGKSSLISALASRGYKAVDTDWNPEWEEPTDSAEGSGWLWREDRIEALLETEDAEILFVSACVENQGKFYRWFDEIVLLSVSAEVTIERLAKRTNNPYGKRPEQAAEVLAYRLTVEPSLRKSATIEIDTSRPLEAVVETLISSVGPMKSFK